MVDGEGDEGYIPGYVTTGEDWQIQVVYGYWVQFNNVEHLSGGIYGNGVWQTRWRAMEAMSARCYDAPSGTVVRKFVCAMAT